MDLYIQKHIKTLETLRYIIKFGLRQLTMSNATEFSLEILLILFYYSKEQVTKCIKTRLFQTTPMSSSLLSITS